MAKEMLLPICTVQVRVALHVWGRMWTSATALHTSLSQFLRSCCWSSFCDVQHKKYISILAEPRFRTSCNGSLATDLSFQINRIIWVVGLAPTQRISCNGSLQNPVPNILQRISKKLKWKSFV